MDQARVQLMKDLEQRTRYMFRKVQTELRQLSENYIPWNEFVVLQIINHKGPLMASEIANEIEVTSSHITTVTDKLIKRDMVRRTRSVKDRRIVYLEITETGRAVAQTMEHMRTRYYQEKFQNLTNEEMQLMSKLFDKFN